MFPQHFYNTFFAVITHRWILDFLCHHFGGKEFVNHADGFLMMGSTLQLNGLICEIASCDLNQTDKYG